MLKHWDYLLGGFGTIITVITKDDIAIIAGIITILILVPRAIIWWISLWQKWRDKDQPYKQNKE